MALRNINTIQNPSDTAYLSGLTDKYMYEALANLGQRYSVKGDSIKPTSFTTLDIFGIDKSYLDEGDYITKVSVINNKLYLQLYEIGNITPLLSTELQYTVNNVVYTDSDIRLTNKINGIDYYKDNMLIYLDESLDELTICSLGCDTDLGVVEVNIDKYNINTNMLVSSLKLTDINDDTYYYLYGVAEYDKTNNSERYKGYLYKINRTIIDGKYTDFQTYAQLIFNNTIKEYYNEFGEISTYSILNEIILDGYVNGISDEPVNIAYNDSYTGLYTEEYAEEFNSILLFIYNQWMYMYKFMFEYYCNYIYKVNNTQLYRYIIYKLYNKALTDSELNGLSKSNFAIYIPVDYTFDYYCKDTDSFYIYANETPVYILFTLDAITDEYIVNNKTVILAPHASNEKVITYKYSVNYNSESTELINNIIVSEMYTMPYVLDGYWYINNVRTNYKAIGEDAGNPNIILIYTDNIYNKTSNFTTGDYTILSTINTDILNTAKWDKQTVNVELFDNLNLSTSNIDTDYVYKISSLIPDFSENITDVFEQIKGSLIISISNINNIITKTTLNRDNEISDIKGILGNSAFITTFWVFNNETKLFENVSNPINNNYALTLANLNNINSIVNTVTNSAIYEKVESLSGNSFKFDNIVINTINPNLKNNLDEEVGTTYAVIYNNSYLSDTLEEFDNSVDYENPYMLNLKYLYNYDGITTENDTKYISALPLSSVSNILARNHVSGISDEAILNYTYEYNSNISLPIVNCGETFNMNVNTLNRTNICSIDSNGNLYYAYMGTSDMTADKSVLHIGTGNINTHIGTDTLINANIVNQFNKHTGLSLDFNNTYVNGNLKVSGNVEIDGYNCILPQNTIKQITDNTYIASSIYNYTIDDTATVSLYDCLITKYSTSSAAAVSMTYTTKYTIGNVEYTNDNVLSTNLVLMPLTNLIEYSKTLLGENSIDYTNLTVSSNMIILSDGNIEEASFADKYILTNKHDYLNNTVIDLNTIFTVENGVISYIYYEDTNNNKSNMACNFKFSNII